MAAGVFLELWRVGLERYDELKGLDWSWLSMDGANRHDMKPMGVTVDSPPVSRPTPSPEHPQGMCLDKGYDFAEVRRTLDEFGSPPTSAVEAKRRRPSNGRPVSNPALGGGTHA